MKRTLPATLACSLVFAAVPLPGAAAAPVAGAGPRVDFERYALPNGLSVILHVDRKLPLVHVNLWYHVGSKDERLGRSGFAHLFEHMMFEGSKNATNKYFTVCREGRCQRLRGRPQWHDGLGPHELFRHGAVWRAGVPVVARVRSPGHAGRGGQPGAL